MAKTKKKNDETADLIASIIEAMEEKKAQKITLLDLRLLSSAATDYFIICHGDNTRQVEAIGREIDERVKRQTGEDAWHIEGMQNGEWVLLDYINVVAHVFLDEKRSFFGLEELWGDAQITQVSN